MSSLTKSFSNVREKYEIMEVLGKGSYGIVRKCQNRMTGEYAAIKTIRKAEVDNLEHLRREIQILKQVKHPHIIELYDIYEDKEHLHLVTELCVGGELYDRVIEKTESSDGHFSEEDAAVLIRDILDAIRYCHDEIHIVHRDLKPENFLLKDDSEDSPIKIIDFGLSRKDDSPFGIMSSRVGTAYYVAPEVLQNSYTYKCDMWSIGIITYLLLCGFAPFSGDTDYETLQLIQSAELEFPSPEWDGISDLAKDFVSQLLHRGPFQRPTAAEAMLHPWISRHVVPPETDMPPPLPFSIQEINDENIDFNNFTRTKSQGGLAIASTRRSAFKKFLAGLKVKKALTVLAKDLNLTSAEAAHLGSIFTKVDKDRDGTVSVKDIDDAIERRQFSQTVRDCLKEVRVTLAKHPAFSLNIKPFIDFTVERSKSEPLSRMAATTR